MAPSNTRSERIASRKGVSRRVGLIRLCYRVHESRAVRGGCRLLRRGPASPHVRVAGAMTVLASNTTTSASNPLGSTFRIATGTRENRRINDPRVCEQLSTEAIARNIPPDAVGIVSNMIIIELDKKYASRPEFLDMGNGPPHVVITAAIPIVPFAPLSDPKGLAQGEEIFILRYIISPGMLCVIYADNVHVGVSRI